ncbi:DUF1877 family protein [Streptomyces sp. NPDC001744]|uniref:DUF1877 family protein n=1 Tax=Streptomyces sp. NPDC001744 TaxID=3364606 RepID=UPI00367DD4DA
MGLTLTRMSEDAVREGTDTVLRRFEDIESALLRAAGDDAGGSPAGTYCALDEEDRSLRAVLTPALGAEAAENATSGAQYLGEDGHGTTYGYLDLADVAATAEALAAVDFRALLASTDASVLGFRHGLAHGYLEDLRERAEALTELFALAAKEGEYVVKKREG